ncbi:DegT/DnrJ/EryC1/StrS family aminotransferase [Paenibacillus xerothermodurans]|uniref:Pyridoxal phosphate-dependent aminotransferase n=1 Tax=Paenibacillus xerothermodurans TaxID=1977292 RepID=A0A2W1N779_PAEXE|nr:aminotransferase class I/II-fold pyridoxal phosphate-dependent enzyme [Paenibacillus xerothermodurans]PZE20469.1 pyridoxal phosphate-dependent aminotransferase [Paenibacillus xerothermodurans]
MTHEPRIYLSPPHMGGREQVFVQDAFESNWIAPVGPNVDAFENELSEYVGSRGAVALHSGTSAIHLALRLLGVSAGDTVFCSSLTFVASANPILYLGAAPVFIDSEPHSWNMSPEALEAAFLDSMKMGQLPKAVVVVNLYGQSADYDAILQICDRYGVPVIEDAAESLGASYRGKKSGSMGKFGIFSFNGNKIITTSGGGMLVSNDLDALDKARFWSTQARDQALHYQHSEIGYNYRLSNLLAGVGRAQLQELDARVAARRNIFERYYAELSHIAGVSFMPEHQLGKCNRWLTALTVDPDVCGITATEIVTKLAERNIEARPVWKPLHLQPLFTGRRYYAHGSGISETLFSQGLCLPSGSNLTEYDQTRVIQAILGIMSAPTVLYQ